MREQKQMAAQGSKEEQKDVSSGEDDEAQEIWEINWENSYL